MVACLTLRNRYLLYFLQLIEIWSISRYFQAANWRSVCLSPQSLSQTYAIINNRRTFLPGCSYYRACIYCCSHIGGIAMTNPPSGTVTFLFTDIEGSTKLWEQYPRAMQAAVARHDIL